MLDEVLEDEIHDSGKYIAEVIYGANDGSVTTFAVVSGVARVALNPSIVLVLGAANLFGDGFSMGMNNYLSRRSEMDYRETVGSKTGAAATGGDEKSPARTAFATFAAFVVGASRSLVTDRAWYVNGGEMLVVGMVAASVAFFVDSLLKVKGIA